MLKKIAKAHGTGAWQAPVARGRGACPTLSHIRQHISHNLNVRQHMSHNLNVRQAPVACFLGSSPNSFLLKLHAQISNNLKIKIHSVKMNTNLNFLLSIDDLVSVEWLVWVSRRRWFLVRLVLMRFVRHFVNRLEGI